MNTTDDGDEPVGEAPELTIPRVVSLLDRQTQALNEIRSFLGTVDSKPFVGGIALSDFKLSGEKDCAAVIAAILERHGLT